MERFTMSVMIGTRVGNILQKSLAGMGSKAHALIGDLLMILRTSCGDWLKGSQFMYCGHFISHMCLRIQCSTAADVIINFSYFAVKKLSKFTGQLVHVIICR